MKRRMLAAEVSRLLVEAQNYKDETGRVHSPVLLEWAEAVLQGKPVGSDEKTIKLEQGGAEKYQFETVAWLLANLPGQMPVDGHTDYEDNRLDGSALKFEKADFSDFWRVEAGGE